MCLLSLNQDIHSTTNLGKFQLSCFVHKVMVKIHLDVSYSVWLENLGKSTLCDKLVGNKFTFLKNISTSDKIISRELVPSICSSIKHFFLLSNTILSPFINFAKVWAWPWFFLTFLLSFTGLSYAYCQRTNPTEVQWGMQFFPFLF